MDQSTYFITGATGLVGTEVVSQLLATTQSKVRVLVRAASEAEAESRLRGLWGHDPHLTDAIGHRVVAIAGDITQPGLGLDEYSRQLLLFDTTHVVHSAAETGVQRSRSVHQSINVEGTRHLVQLAEGMPMLQCFVHISTAYVAGTRSGIILEDGPLSTQHYTLYERCKAQAERVVRDSRLPYVICRPGMVVGHSVTGHTRNFNTVYYVLKLMLQGRMRLMPVSRSQRVNIIPVDEVARGVVQASVRADAIGHTLHLTPPYESLPTVGQLEVAVRQWAQDHLHIRLPRLIYLPMPWLRHVARWYNAGAGEKSRSLLSNLIALMPYFVDDHIFSRINTDRFVGRYRTDWRQSLPVMLDFACRHNFMRLSDRNIFQQACVRRDSRHYPITYYDITAQGVVPVTGQQMNGIVSHYVGQLQSMGVRTGDAVALSGVNCVEYIAIDQAIGLLGAVSVPIYYTTPGPEIVQLLRKSGARWFFVGDDRVMRQTVDVPADVQVVPFGPLVSTHVVRRLADQPVAPLPHISFDDSRLATIRFTSGTTGEPKGVMFNFRQLKWMGEVLSNLLSWRDRNREMRYLSFLPLSHVVEGILAAYVPYCLVCQAQIYYLNDFQQLTRALPMVRPTVFFSVPRFFEKLWQQIEQHPLGRRYLAMSPGPLRRLTGRVLRWAVLRRAGLDQCSQLIVGSAPISQALLQRFRSLGIEIHNAYGQTEAPLITLNRLGDNDITGIGTPLPQTQVRVAPDGELLVRGPQVAMGYYQMDSPTFRDGVLHTGDLGSVAPSGHVSISGRKKDILITSYGKNINCNKIEQYLTDIPGIDQAVLVGEQRPYCTALLWSRSDHEHLRAAIEQMNHRLSHPEQVRRWHFVERPLSISSGELTPNLKVRRSVVISHYSQDIDSMYAAH
ncbi:MAG: AMP-binding protein [Bacteroidales bacterium]|nr:AMP-binding protein [Bacteroidales bacterium]